MAKEAERRARAAAREAARSRSLELAARVGTVATGLLYVLVGYICAHIAATRHADEQATARGALELVAATPLGAVLLWLVAGGLGGLALRQAALVVFGGRMGAWATQRVAAVGRTVVYSLLFATVLRVAIGAATGGGSQDRQSEHLTALLLGLPLGRVLVALIGLTLVGFGVALVFTMFRRNAYTHDVDFAAMPRRLRPAVVALNVAGNLSRVAIVTLAGGFVVWAALDGAPDHTQGLDDTLRSVSQAPAGPWLLSGIAAGLASYGLYCFCKARWPRT
ncbi:DUF1206 domain-containing protein [Streptomonospora sp. PA3]|uniref:DUF1206 domain-containing protein n=1 Tax=Streptomonospora sp. PA3 TaxID=2607326 RepID=UPI001642CA03|nr:DUF1206 domain-containing protein [Streptomonospora sp. PA3]